VKRKRFSVKQIVAVLKQAEVGMPVADVIRQIGISEQTFYRWKKQYAGLQSARFVSGSAAGRISPFGRQYQPAEAHAGVGRSESRAFRAPKAGVRCKPFWSSTIRRLCVAWSVPRLPHWPTSRL